MSGGQIAATMVALYLVVAAGVCGALLERERLQNPDGERGWKWLGSLAFAVLCWPVLGLLWSSSRPAPSQPQGGYDFSFLSARSMWEWQGPVAQEAYHAGMTTVDTARTLADLPLLPMGQRVFIHDLQIVVEKLASSWRAVACACVWNRLGFPMVVCRTHRTDEDPQGEPDETEGDVGR